MIENYEFPLTEEIKELGISRVYTGVNNTGNEIILLIERKGLENHPLQCVYNKTSLKKTAKEARISTHYGGI